MLKFISAIILAISCLLIGTLAIIAEVSTNHPTSLSTNTAISPQANQLALNTSINYLTSSESHSRSRTLVFAPTTNVSTASTNVIYFVISIFSLFLAVLFWYRNQLKIVLIFSFVSIFLISQGLEFIIKNNHKHAEVIDLVEQVASLSARLEGVLQTNLSMLTGFAAYISAVPNLSQQDFNNYAKELFKKEPLLINFAAAKDLKVNYIYPLKGNEQVIGLNYNKNPEQKKMVLQVANSNKLVVIGPINLVQGGTAFIGRAGIFTGDGENRHLWGIISAPLDEMSLYREAGLTSSQKELNIALKNFDLLGNEEAVFFGDSSIFNSQERVELALQVGGGFWTIAATKKQISLPSLVISIRITAIILSVVVLIFIYIKTRQENEKQKLNQTIAEHRRLLGKVGSVAKIGGWKVNSNFEITQWLKETSETLNKPASFLPKTIFDLLPCFEEKGFELFQEQLEHAFKHKTEIDIKILLNNNNNNNNKDKETWIRVFAKPSLYSPSKHSVTGTFQDISDKVYSAKLIEHQATYDALTDLPNRLLFNSRLSNDIKNAKLANYKLGILFIDLDRFKPVNDNYGHRIGDKLLIQTAQRIKSCLRESDTVSRISGDEFCVLLTNIHNFDHITKIVETILIKLQTPYQLANSIIHCSASIGISLYPNDGNDAQSLISKADQAMYQVKSKGRNDWQFYTQEMQVQSERRHRLLNELIIDLKKGKLQPYFQPIFQLNSNTIAKCEALARWQRSDGSYISPDEFIPLAEESGLINQLDLYMLKESAKMLQQIKQNTKEVELSINISPRLFNIKDKNLLHWLDCVEKISQKIPLTIEITERLLTQDSFKALEILNQLKTYRVKIAIDDFGTGYSSLSYLVRFPVDIIKIDREFIDKLSQDETSDALVESMLLMAKRLNIKVVAEGIEEAYQLSRLKDLGCEFGQGYYLGKPMNYADFSEFVTTNLNH